jgi:prepilin-type N-terminal cleavage/methylation domain-containing protein
MRNTRKGFTLIELMIVIAIIAIIAAIAIPGILSARRSANSGSAMGNLKSFSTAMATFAQDDSEQKYPAATSNFGDYYSHVSPKGGYKYIYVTNDNKSRFVYLAAPTSINNGTKVFFVDESNRIYETVVTTDSQINELSTDDIDPDKVSGNQASVTGANWVIKS